MSYVSASPNRCGGAMCIRNTRLTTATIRALRDERGLDTERILALYPELNASDVEVALWWEDREDEDEPDPEPSGRWVVVTTPAGEKPFWRDDRGNDWNLANIATRTNLRDRAEAALVDLIESDHLPPQMPSVDDIDRWISRHGHAYVPQPTRRTVIRGTLDAIVAITIRNRETT